MNQDDEVRLARELRPSVEDPSAQEVAQARQRLQSTIQKANAVGGASKSWLPRRSLPRAVVAVLAIAAVPGAFAVAQMADSGSEFSGAPAVPVSDCPEAARAFDAAGVRHPDEYPFKCPSPAQVDQWIKFVQEAEATRERLEEEGLFLEDGNVEK